MGEVSRQSPTTPEWLSSSGTVAGPSIIHTELLMHDRIRVAVPAIKHKEEGSLS